MISVSAEVYRALSQPNPKIHLRVKWYPSAGIDGMDITERVISVSAFTHSMTLFLGGAEISGTSLILDNSDGKVGPAAPAFFQQAASTYMSIVTIERGVTAADGAIEYWTAYTGRITDVIYLEGTAELYLEDATRILDDAPLPEDYTIPWNEDPVVGDTNLGTIVEDLLDLSPLSKAVLDTGTRTFWTGKMNKDLGWMLGGTISAGTWCRAAITDVCRSVLVLFLPSRLGTVSLMADLPEWSGSSYANPRLRPGFLFDETNSADFRRSFLVGGMVSQVTVAYQNRLIAVRDTTNEDVYGWRNTVVQMPYCVRGQQAAWAAQWLLNSAPSASHNISFFNDGLGHLVEMNDWVRVKDPATDEENVYRVLSARYSDDGVTIGGVKEDNQELIATSFAMYGLTTWGAAEVLL